MRAFLRKYWIEVIILMGLIVGVLLLLARVNVFKIAEEIITTAWSALGLAVTFTWQGIIGYFKGIEFSDLAGLVLVVGGGTLLLWRVRQRFIVSGRYRGRNCPRCGGWFLRVHRTFLDRVLGAVLFLRFFRYRCSNLECGWEGLRKPGRRQEQFNIAEIRDD